MTLTNEKVREELEAYIVEEQRKGATVRAKVLQHALRTVGAERALLDAAAMLNPRNRRAIWTLRDSDVTLEWPSNISLEDVNDLEEWLTLTIRIMKRTAIESAQSPAQTPEQAKEGRALAEGDGR